jgi:hypothetical protein
MKLVALQSVVSSEAASVSGCLLPAWRPCFQGVYRCHLTAGPRALASPGSSSHELYLSYRVSTAPNLPPHLRARTPPLAFRSPSRHQQKESTCERASQAHPTVHPRRFSRPRWFAPLSALRIFFTPQPRPGFTFQGFSPAAQPERLIVAPFPLAGWRPSPATELPRRLQLRPPRLQGFGPCSDSKPPTR